MSACMNAASRGCPLLDKGDIIPSEREKSGRAIETGGGSPWKYHSASWGACKYETRLKFLNGELAEIMMVNRPIFNPDGIPEEKSKRTKGGRAKNDGESADDVSDIARSKRRARKMVFDLAMCNPELDTFVTFTIAPDSSVDRYDVNAAVRRLGQWLSNRVRRKGLRYVFVCELHKDGAAHFHGLLNSGAVKLVDSGIKDKRGNVIYNVTDWKLGFTTAVKLHGSRAAVCKYICKYISKSPDRVGGRWYYSGGDLRRPTYEYMGASAPEDWALEGFDRYTHEVESAGLKFEILTRRRF